MIILKIVFIILDLLFLFSNTIYEKKSDKGLKMWIILQLLIMWVIL